MDPLRISIVGLSRWESVFVQTSVDLASGMDLPPCRFVEDPQGADVLLVDADHRRYVSLDDSDDAGKPVVVSFTADTAPSEAGRGLTRPVGYAELISMLKEIETELQDLTTAAEAPEPVADEPIEPEAKPEPTVVKKPDTAISKSLLDSHGRAAESLSDKARPARRFVEATRLLGILGRIVRWGIPAEVMHSDYPRLLIVPKRSAFITSGKPLMLPRMFRESATSFAIRDVPEDMAEAAVTSGEHQPLSRLIYCAALFGSEGRLTLYSNPQDRLTLIGTPDFDVVPHLPEHRTIARFLIANAADLADIAEATGVSISVVIDFCNACEAAGLIRRIPAGGGDKPNVDEHNVLQLFGRVRDLFREP